MLRRSTGIPKGGKDQGAAHQEPRMTIKFLFLFSRQGKQRLMKWFTSYTEKDKKKLSREVISMVLARGPKMCSFLEYREDLKIVYKRYVGKPSFCFLIILFLNLPLLFPRYASLFFCVAIESGDNELLALEVIHHFVEVSPAGRAGATTRFCFVFHFTIPSNCTISARGTSTAPRLPECPAATVPGRETHRALQAAGPWSVIARRAQSYLPLQARKT